MVLKRIETQLQHTSARGDCIRVVPLKVLCHSVPYVHSFPERIVTWIEGPTILIEFIGEDKFQFSAIWSLLGKGRLGRVRVYESRPYILQ